MLVAQNWCQNAEFLFVLTYTMMFNPCGTASCGLQKLFTHSPQCKLQFGPKHQCNNALITEQEAKNTALTILHSTVPTKHCPKIKEFQHNTKHLHVKSISIWSCHHCCLCMPGSCCPCCPPSPVNTSWAHSAGFLSHKF